MPSVRPAPPGTDALPFVELATPAPLLNVEMGSPPAVQVEFAQTWKVTVPVSFGSGSLKVAVSEGVIVFSCAAFEGLTSAGVVGAMFAVLLVTLMPLTVAAGLPVGVAVSRTFVPPGWV